MDPFIAMLITIRIIALGIAGAIVWPRWWRDWKWWAWMLIMPIAIPGFLAEPHYITAP